jgi:hypothetical protein
VRAVFTYWYMDIYDIPEKIWDYRIHDAIHCAYLRSKLYFKYTVWVLYKDRDLRSSFLKVPNCLMDLAL